MGSRGRSGTSANQMSQGVMTKRPHRPFDSVEPSPRKLTLSHPHAPTPLPTLKTRYPSRSTVKPSREPPHKSFIADASAPPSSSQHPPSPTSASDAGPSRRQPPRDTSRNFHSTQQSDRNGLYLPENNGFFLVLQSPQDREVGRRRPHWSPRLSATLPL